MRLLPSTDQRLNDKFILLNSRAMDPKHEDVAYKGPEGDLVLFARESGTCPRDCMGFQCCSLKPRRKQHQRQEARHY